MKRASRDTTPPSLPSPAREEDPCQLSQGDQSLFEWGELVARIVHPLQVAIIEALLWIGQPLSPTELAKSFDEPTGHYLALVSYHVTHLKKMGVLVPIGIRHT